MTGIDTPNQNTYLGRHRLESQISIVQLFTPEATSEREREKASTRIHPILAALIAEKKRKQELPSPPDHTPPERCEILVPSPPAHIQVMAIPGNDDRVAKVLTVGKAWNSVHEEKYMLREWAWYKYSDKQAILIIPELPRVLKIREREDKEEYVEIEEKDFDGQVDQEQIAMLRKRLLGYKNEKKFRWRLL